MSELGSDGPAGTFSVPRSKSNPHVSLILNQQGRDREERINCEGIG